WEGMSFQQKTSWWMGWRLVNRNIIDEDVWNARSFSWKLEFFETHKERALEDCSSRGSGLWVSAAALDERGDVTHHEDGRMAACHCRCSLGHGF
ncbi:MAG: hypothetical protein LC700_02280, partial [Actinobacteria bacterium]|nr:hypothetical protein [Actinomycetota bacterium]